MQKPHKKRVWRLPVWTAILSIVLMFVSFFVYFSQILRLSHQKMEEYLTNAVKHCASEVKNQMNTELNKIQNLAEMIGNSGPLGVAKTVAVLAAARKAQSYQNIMSRTFLNGKGYFYS